MRSLSQNEARFVNSGRIVGNTEITRGSNLNFGAVVLEKRGFR